MANKWITHVKQYAAQHGISYAEAMIKAKASYKPIKKLKGGQTLKDWGLEQYNHIPEHYHPGIESLGHAAFSQMGFGMKKTRKPRKKGGDIFSDIGNAFRPVAQAFRPVVDAGTKLGDWQTKNIRTVVNNPVVKKISKQVAKEVLKYGAAAAPAAAAAAATAAGNPELAPAAAFLALQLANEMKPIGDDYIDRYDGVGLRKRKVKKGRALMPAGVY
jgi:hypothetical protein